MELSCEPEHIKEEQQFIFNLHTKRSVRKTLRNIGTISIDY